MRGDAGRAIAGVAGLCLQAAQSKHKAPCAVAPVSTQRHQAGNVKSADDLASAANLDAVPQADTAQRVVHQEQALLQWRAHVVGKFKRRSTRAALRAVHHDKVGRDAGGHHRLDHGKPLPRVANAQLETGGFTAGQIAQLGDEMHHLHGRTEGTVRGGRDAVHPHRHAACLGNFWRHLGPRQYATVARLGPLAELDFYHLHLRVAGIG